MFGALALADAILEVLEVSVVSIVDGENIAHDVLLPMTDDNHPVDLLLAIMI